MSRVFIDFPLEICYNSIAAISARNWKEVKKVGIITSFLVSVAAGVVSYYICKWLDEHQK